MFQIKDCKYFYHCHCAACTNIYFIHLTPWRLTFSFFRFKACMGIALAIAICALLLAATLFIPNAILVALKYRSGILPSLRSEGFMRYRKNLTTLTFLIPGEF